MPAHALHGPVLRWYGEHARDLPWRRPECSPWGVFVSEVMAQQTPIARILPTWQEWMRRWPTPAELAAQTPATVIRAWGRLGYPRRALRLHEAATVMLARHGGDVPDDEAGLRALPGVGEYTAAAVAAFAFGRRTCVLDTNVRRVLARTVNGTAFAAPALTVAERSLAARLVPDDAATACTWAVASMELGALVCTARGPACATCPVADLCTWRRAGFPVQPGPPRRAQRFQGTDRQVRGRILQALRSSATPVSAQHLATLVPAESLRDPRQRERCLGSLLSDGLIDVTAAGHYCLPTGGVAPPHC